jgi:hypothetical protein
MAIHNISKQDADKLVQLLLSINGRNAVGTSVGAVNQLQAIKASLSAMKPDTEEFDVFVGQLTDLAINTNSWETYKAIIDAIGSSAKTTKEFIDGLTRSLLAQGDIVGAQNITALAAMGYTEEQIIAIQVASAAGVGVNTTNKKRKGYVDLKPADTGSSIELQKKIAEAKKKNAAATKILEETQNKLNKSTEASLKPLEAQQKILEDNLKTLQDAQKVKQQENSFATTKTDLKNQIMMAQANGDNLKAQLLQQELMAKSQDYGFQQQIDEAQNKVNEGAARIAELKTNADANAKKIVDQVKESGKEVADAIPALIDTGTNKSNATNLGTAEDIYQRFPEFKTRGPGGSLNPGISPSKYNDPFGPLIGPGSARQNIKRLAEKMGYDEGRTFSIDEDGIRYKFRVVKDGNIRMMEKKPISNNAKGGYIKNYSDGSPGGVRGPGTKTSDSIPAYLSNGEYVIKADSVSKYGVGLFDAFNAGKFADGGSVFKKILNAATSPLGAAGFGIDILSKIDNYRKNKDIGNYVDDTWDGAKVKSRATVNPDRKIIYVYDMANRFDSKDRKPIVDGALEYLKGQTGVTFKRATFGMRNDPEVISLNWSDSKRLAEKGSAGDSVPGSKEVNLISPRGLNAGTAGRRGGIRTLSHEILHSLNIGNYTNPNGSGKNSSWFDGHAKNPFNIMFPMSGMWPGFVSKQDTEDLRSLTDYYHYDVIHPGEKLKKAMGGYINIPKFETGINSVPADMIAMLHKNEAVIPANMNPFNPNASNGVTINTSITVGSISNEIDFDALIKKNNDDIIKKMKMNGLVSKVGR